MSDRPVPRLQGIEKRFGEVGASRGVCLAAVVNVLVFALSFVVHLPIRLGARRPGTPGD